MKFSIKHFFSISSHLLKKFLTGNFIFGAAYPFIRMPYFGVYTVKLKKRTIVIFEIRILEYGNMQKFVKTKISILRQRMPYLGIFEL